jgi:ABC-type polysaccharide/polyol phosphate export permease
MAGYLTEIWRCRYFWLSLVQMDLRVRYRRSVIGIGWSLLQPLMMTAILCFVFHRVFNESITDYAPYLLTGLACWQYLVSVTVQGADSFFAAEHYIRQSPAPLAIYPLRVALGGSVHFLIALALAMLIRVVFLGPPDSLAFLAIVPALLLFFLLVWSLAIVAGIATVMFQDIRHLLEVAFQILFYLTPILYRAPILQERGLLWLMQLNPVVAFLELIRGPMLEGKIPSPMTYAMALATVMLTVSLAALALVRLQRRLIFYL